MPEINWGLLKQPDFVGNAYAAKAQGQADRLDKDKRNAYALYSQDPEAGAAAVMAIDPQTGLALRQANREEQNYQGRNKAIDQLGSGDQAGAIQTALKYAPDLVAHIDKLDDRRKAEAAVKAEKTASVLAQFQGKKPEEIAAGIAAVEPQLRLNGLDDNDIAALKGGNPGAVDAYVAIALGTKGVIDQRNTDRTYDAGRADATFSQGMETKKFGETVRSNRVGEGQRSQQIGLEAQRVGIARQTAAQAGDGVSKATRATEAGLRKEFNGLADVKNYRTVATQAAAVKRLAAAPPSANGDIAMVYAVMKSYDPTSVVRETEFATAQNAAGVPDKIRNQFNAIRNGQRLNPKQRQEMATTVAGFADTYKQRFDTVADEYRSYATDYSGDPDRVVAKSTPTPAAPASTGSVLRFDARGNRIK
jgi:hypothetical protein